MQRVLSFYILTVLCFAVSTCGYAQKRQSTTVYGAVTDSTGIGVRGVNVFLTGRTDTLFTSTNGNGEYRIRQVKDSLVNVVYSMLGRETVRRTFYLGRLTPEVFLPNIKMKSGFSEIDPVQVLKTIPIINKGDTTVYNMAAFNILKNSLLEDALRNSLPGFSVLRDGTTFYNGRLITSVQVDGRKFFGGDVLTATKNLPADYISQIEVIDYYGDSSEEKGIKNKEPEKIINIILKEDRKQILFGQVTAGGGSSDRYLGSVGINKFNKGQELSVVGSINNTNTSLFSFGSPNGTGRAESLSDVGDYADQADGLNKISSIGLTFSEDVTPITTLSGRYAYTNSKNETTGNSLLTSTYAGYRISKRDEYRTMTDDKTHRLNLELTSRFKNNDFLKIQPNLTLNRYSKDNVRNNVLRNYRLTNRGVYQDSSINDNPSAQVTALYAKQFRKPGSRLVADAAFNYNHWSKNEDVVESYVILDTTSGEATTRHFAQRQHVEQFNKERSVKASISYVEPFANHSLLSISHDYELTEISTSRRVNAPIAGDVSPVDSLTLSYDYLFSSNRTGLAYQYEPSPKFRANIGFAVQPLRLMGQVANDTLVHRYDNINLVPSATIKYRFNDEIDWQFTYNGKNNQPNFLHISPIRDNSNSRNIIVGNPLLRAEFINRLSTVLRKSIMSKSQYFELNMAYNFTNNKIVPVKTASFGETIQETTFTNTDGYYELKGYYTFNTPFVNDDFNLDLSGSLDYFNNIIYVNENRNLTKQYLFSQNLQLRYNWEDYFESVFNTNYFLNQAVYEQPRTNTVAAHSVLFSLGSRGYLTENLMIGAEMSQKYFRGYAVDITDVSPTIINTYLEYSFLKNRMALIRLQCFDILDQNRNVGVFTEYVGNDIYESRNNRLGRYFLLSLNMRLQRTPKK